METTTTTVESYDYYHIGFIPLLIVLALALIPYWKLWSRTGHSGAWSLLLLIPLVNVISIWVLAFKKWPAVDR